MPIWLPMVPDPITRMCPDAVDGGTVAEGWGLGAHAAPPLRYTVVVCVKNSLAAAPCSLGP